MEAAEAWLEAAVRDRAFVAAVMNGTIYTAAAVFVLLQFVTAPFGRHAVGSLLSESFGPKINARLAWILQESPALVLPLVIRFRYADPNVVSHPVNMVLLGMFVLHYANRALVYPFQMRGGKPMPLGVMLLAFFYCVSNGFLQGVSLCVMVSYETAWVRTPNFIVGFFLFVLGFVWNLQADAQLRSLRRPGETGYKIPRGGLFEYVSGANFFAEMVEWLGFALATSNAAGWAFFVFTAANLIPRAVSHHRWYQDKFKESYPRFRKAVIPFLL